MLLPLALALAACATPGGPASGQPGTLVTMEKIQSARSETEQKEAYLVLQFYKGNQQPLTDKLIVTVTAESVLEESKAPPEILADRMEVTGAKVKLRWPPAFKQKVVNLSYHVVSNFYKCYSEKQYIENFPSPRLFSSATYTFPITLVCNGI